MGMFELIFAGLFGLAFGSFITLASYRLPRDQDIFISSSRCVSCGKKLRPRDLIPVLSWVITAGRCGQCEARVHWRYPLIELITAGLFVLIVAYYGHGIDAMLLLLMTVALMTMIVADFEHYIIPDEVHAVLIPTGIAYRLLTGAEWDSILGGLVLGLAIGCSLRYGYRFLRHKEGLGMGDVKLLAVIGVWVDVRTFVPFLFYAGLLGVLTAMVWRRLGHGKLFPFGPALAMSMFLCVVFPEVPAAFWNLQRLFYQ